MIDSTWNGEGLPPVGERVVIDWAGWIQEADVISHHDGDAVVAFQPVGFNHWQYSRASEVNARPSPSPEQRAVDAMQDALQETGVASRVQRVHANSIYTDIREGRIPGVKLDR